MKKDRKTKIRGSGGGDDAPQQHVPREDPDTLRSKAFLRIVDLISEGEIVGLVDGSKSIYFNETPLEGDTGVLNFSNVTYDTRLGTQSQSYMPGFTTVENDIGVNVEVKQGDSGAVIRQVTNSNINRVRVRVMIPQLTNTDTANGDVHGSVVQFSIYVRPSGGSYSLAASRTVRGKSSSRYEVSVEIELTGDGPWDLKVYRNTNDSNSAYLQDKTFFAAYTEIIDAKLRYPNSAYIGLRIDAQQFQQVPNRAYDVKLLKIRVPDNATVRDDGSLTFSGIWGGDFQVAWCSDPAWVFYDLITSSRYGLGDFISEDQVDKWALYEISQYCSELIDDGLGAQEPRFSCNMMLSSREEAFKVLQSLASVFRGMIYWAGGAITAVQDSPQDAAYLFTPSNVVDGKFTYQGASAKSRHTVALVSWNDPEDFYRLKVEYVEDQDGIARYGVQQTDIVAFGCTSRGQAHRLGKWLLYTERAESETVIFSTGLEGIVGRPGQTIKIADPTRAGARMGGRISSATTTQVTIDQSLTFAVAGNTLSALLPDGTVEERTVIGQSGAVLTVQPAFSTAPNSQSVWMLRSDEVEPQTFRVIGVKEEDSGMFTVTALKHDPDKFDFVEEDIELEPKSYSNLREITDQPQNLAISESLYQSGTEVKSKITVSWDKVDRAVSYVLRYRRDDNNFIELPETQFNDIEILDTQPGTYTFQVAAINAVGKRSPTSELIVEAYGKLAPPADVTGFSMIPNANQAYLTWDQATDLDVIVGGQVRIRHTPNTTGQAWEDAVDIIPAVPGTATSALAPLLSGTYMAKFLDSSGNYSVNPTLIVTTIPYALALNVVETLTEEPGWLGTKTDMQIDTLTGALVLVDQTLVDDFPLIDSVGNWEFPGDVVSSGTYDFYETVDLGGVWPSRIYSVIDLEAYDIGTLIDSHTDLIDDWSNIDGTTIDDVNAVLYMRTTEDDPNATPTWTDWKRIAAGAYSARGLQFQLRCTSGDPAHNLYIHQLEVTIDMEDRAVDMKGLTSGAGIYSVTYPAAFYVAPSVNITALNLSTGDYFQITNESASGFDIVFKNSSSANISRNFNVIAKGYGRRVA